MTDLIDGPYDPTRFSAAAATARSLLAGHPLLAVSGKDITVDLIDVLDDLGLGIVLTGAADLDLISQINARHSGMTVCVETNSASSHIATVDEPFLLPGPDLFRSGSLNDVLDDQRTAGAALAVTPTGHIPVGEGDVLKAVASEANRLDRDDTVVHLPVGAGWLRTENYRQLAAVVARISQPVLVSFAHTTDPSEIVGATSSMRSLASQPHVALHRVDLAGADFLAHGGMTITFGHRPSLRHGSVPQGYSPTPSDRTPRVLLPGMARFMKTSEIAKKWANAEPPTCDCPEDRGLGLDRYTSSSDDINRAHQHNLHIVSDLVQRILVDPAGRLSSWRSILAEAEYAHAAASEVLKLDLKLPGPLKAWLKA
jgi:hypothetical protein